METAVPEKVGEQMRSLLEEYNRGQKKELRDLLDFHVRFKEFHD